MYCSNVSWQIKNTILKKFALKNLFQLSKYSDIHPYIVTISVYLNFSFPLNIERIHYYRFQLRPPFPSKLFHIRFLDCPALKPSESRLFQLVCNIESNPCPNQRRRSERLKHRTSFPHWITRDLCHALLPLYSADTRNSSQILAKRT